MSTVKGPSTQLILQGFQGLGYLVGMQQSQHVKTAKQS